MAEPAQGPHPPDLEWGFSSTWDNKRPRGDIVAADAITPEGRSIEAAAATA